MRIRIHRGAAEIGGNCVELQAQGKRLVLDIGRPLWAKADEHVPLPSIPGLADAGNPSLLGVVLSHAHLDHYGLVDQVGSAVPLYTGEATARILKEAAFFSPAGLDRGWAGFLADREPIQLGPFTVTPYLVDHSAFDAYALLAEADGRRVFYSGDLRGHGLEANVFERLLAAPPTEVDVLLLEGTRVGVAEGDRRSPLTEAELEQQFTQVFSQTNGLVLVAYSAQNIDRLSTLYSAMLNTGAPSRSRDLVIDPYVEAMARATSNPDVPRAGLPRVKVYVPQSQRVKIRRAGDFDRVNEIRRYRLFPEDLRKQRRGLILTFRPSMAAELERAECLDGAHLVWSMWPGYLEEERMRAFHDFLARHDIQLTRIHASGHATVGDLQRLAQALAPTRVVPIHTAGPQHFAELFASVEPHADGEWWEV
jgi:ribonuclease J